jgi:hypothetical protein
MVSRLGECECGSWWLLRQIGEMDHRSDHFLERVKQFGADLELRIPAPLAAPSSVGHEDPNQPTGNRQATTNESGKKGSHACIVTEHVRPWPASATGRQRVRVAYAAETHPATSHLLLGSSCVPVDAGVSSSQPGAYGLITCTSWTSARVTETNRAGNYLAQWKISPPAAISAVSPPAIPPTRDRNPLADFPAARTARPPAGVNVCLRRCQRC